MIGPIALFISWLLQRLEGRGLGELGFNAVRVRAGQLLGGLLIAGRAVAVQQFGMSAAAGVGWKLNPEMDVGRLLDGRP